MPLVLKPPQKLVTFPPSGNDHKPEMSICSSLNNTLSWAFFFFFLNFLSFHIIKVFYSSTFDSLNVDLILLCLLINPNP